ncbi:hypothetical protein OIU74_014474 [Salix koriyanagi]|uniref:Uncharacterized protein n=1 Tax=Salix koriyanagi TaxID=2511006 RepID=A0A9Q0PVS6_9ROSI|nr:hypothetical protein OIU74_014474 [Salix koriyanagi]
MASEGSVIQKGKTEETARAMAVIERSKSERFFERKVVALPERKRKGIECLESPPVLPSSAAAAVVVQTGCFYTRVLGERSEEELLLGNQMNAKCFSWY